VTDSTTDPAYDSAPPNPQITFGDDLTDPEQREAVERDVATIVARYAEAGAQVRAAQAERAPLMNALAAPLMKLIEEDPAARKARDELRTRQLIDLDQEQPLTATNDVITGPSRAALDEPTPLHSGLGGILALRQPPYDFTWWWHNQAGSPPFERVVNHDTGMYRLDARTGNTPGGASKFVDAHAGFGLVFRPAEVTTLMVARGNSRRTLGYAYDTGALGIEAYALAEGGMEFTALENGRLVASDSVKLWRSRVSVDEEAHFDSGPTVRQFRPPELRFTMQPGREYTFNVGVWVKTEKSAGPFFGAGAAHTVTNGIVQTMTVFRD
jgi:hypothetical protein